jgi:hypothetical protein
MWKWLNRLFPPNDGQHHHLWSVTGFFDLDAGTGEYTTYTGHFTGRTYRQSRCDCGAVAYDYVRPYEGCD